MVTCLINALYGRSYKEQCYRLMFREENATEWYEGIPEFLMVNAHIAIMADKYMMDGLATRLLDEVKAYVGMAIKHGKIKDANFQSQVIRAANLIHEKALHKSEIKQEYIHLISKNIGRFYENETFRDWTKQGSSLAGEVLMELSKAKS